MEEYKLDLSKIKPKNIKKSDKYSKQIYQYLNKHKSCNKVYYIQTQEHYNREKRTYETLEVPFDISSFTTSNIWIGYMQKEEYEEGFINWMYGNHLNSIVGDGKNKYECFANPWNNKKTVIDITEQFWNKYIEIGRCIYDHHYWLQDEEDRYTYLMPNHRRCNWCDCEQHEIEKTRTESYKVWE